MTRGGTPYHAVGGRGILGGGIPSHKPVCNPCLQNYDSSQRYILVKQLQRWDSQDLAENVRYPHTGCIPKRFTHGYKVRRKEAELRNKLAVKEKEQKK